MKKTMLFMSLFAFSLNSFAIEESKLTTPEFLSNILPYVLSHSAKGSFIGVDLKKINYYVLAAVAPKGVLVISPGQSESSLKYSELLFDLRDFGYTIYIIDHRGQGESDRLLADPIKSHVYRFSDYVSDFENFVINIVHPEKYASSYLLAHSMGGAIATGFLAKHPKIFTAAILSAPMLQIKTNFPEFVSEIIEKLLDNVFFATSYAYTQGPYEALPFSKNTLTSSPARHSMSITLYDTFKNLRVGGTTNSWLNESLMYTKMLRNKKNIFQIPTLLFQAGRDQWVRPEGQNQTCIKNSSDFCKIIKFPTSQHEILMEKDVIRDQALLLIKEFISTSK